MQLLAPKEDQIPYTTSKFLDDYKKAISAFLDLRKVLKLQGDFSDIEKLTTEVSRCFGILLTRLITPFTLRL